MDIDRRICDSTFVKSEKVYWETGKILKLMDWKNDLKEMLMQADFKIIKVWVGVLKLPDGSFYEGFWKDEKHGKARLSRWKKRLRSLE